MDFGLTEEQEMLQETVRGFVNNECPPPKLREIFDGGEGHAEHLWSGLAEMGIAGLIVPEEFGGAEMETLDLALVSEVLGGGAVPDPFLGHSLACLCLIIAGSTEQKSEWLPKLAEGSCIGSLAFCEEGSRWEPEGWSTRRSADRISGTKLFVPHAHLAQLMVVGCEGGELVRVDPRSEGIRIESMEGIDRTRPVFRVEFENAECEALSVDAAGLQRVRDVGHVLLAADAFGAASTLVDMSVEYAKTREQFSMKIGQFQAVKHQLARLGTEIEPSRALFWYAAYAVDHLPEEAHHAAALAKAHITDRAMHTARSAVELHGGLGFTWECDVQMWFKRWMFNRTFMGTPEALREQCASLAGW